MAGIDAYRPEWFLLLMEWYRVNKRDLPWRKAKDGYPIWVSEIMLQQTRVEAVKEYYKRFLEKFPTVKHLAEAEEEELLKAWEGLGYYSRVRNMQRAALVVQQELEGQFPCEYDILITLPGIGPYTAGAISSIVGNSPSPAVDGNVLRILARVAGDDSNISNPAHVKRIREELKAIMEGVEGVSYGEWNQAMMELGAIVCLPNGMPKCDACPWKEICAARREGRISEFPVKDKGKERRIEEKTLLLLHSTKGLALHKRPERGLLAGMYEIPSLAGRLGEKEVLREVKLLGYHPIKIERLPDAKHIFSHVEWHMQAYSLRVDEVEDPTKRDIRNDFFFVSEKELKDKYPLPSAFLKYYSAYI